MTDRHIDYVPLSDVTEATRNPKGHDDILIADSITTFGYIEPVQLDERTGRLIAGHGRLDNLRQMESKGGEPPDGIQVDDSGAWLLPVVRGWASRDDAHAEAALLTLNRGVERGGWNDAGVAAILQDLVEVEPGLVATAGYTDAELAILLDRYTHDDSPDDPMIEPPAPADAVTKPGDVWLLGPHRVVCGSATDPATVDAAMNGQPIDLVFTSPPYNVGVDYADNDDDLPWDEYRQLLLEVVTQCAERMAPGRVLAWNIGASPRIRAHHQMMLIEDAGLELWRQIIWRKVGVPIPSFFHTRKDPRARRFFPNYVHEFVLLFTKGPVEYGEPIIIDDLLRDDVFDLTQMAATLDLPSDGSQHASGAPTANAKGGKAGLQTGRGKVHPAPFPIRLPAAFTQMLADPGAVVFDPFMGSGSTIIAAHQTGRVAAGVELAPSYCDVICQRFQRITGVVPILESTGDPVSFEKG